MKFKFFKRCLILSLAAFLTVFVLVACGNDNADISQN